MKQIGCFILLLCSFSAWGQDSILLIPDYRLQLMEKRAETLVNDFLDEVVNLNELTRISSREEFEVERASFLKTKDLRNQASLQLPSYEEVVDEQLEAQEYALDRLLEIYTLNGDKIWLPDFLALDGSERKVRLKSLLRSAGLRFRNIDLNQLQVNICTPCDNRSIKNTVAETFVQVNTQAIWMLEPTDKRIRKSSPAVSLSFHVRFDVLDGNLLSDPKIYYIEYLGDQPPACSKCQSPIQAQASMQVEVSEPEIAPLEETPPPAEEVSGKLRSRELHVIVEARKNNPDKNRISWTFIANAGKGNTVKVRTNEDEFVMTFPKPIEERQLISMKVNTQSRADFSKARNVYQKNGRLYFKIQ
ncbi:MAG: hypothetical protein AAF740_14435 [Bacteroidota bacterium]